MTMHLFGGWLMAFTFTQVIEVPLYLRITHRWSTSLLASCITHPVVWFVFPAVWPEQWSYWSMVAGCEVFAVGVEAVWLQMNGIHRSLLISFIVNGASATAGLLLRQMFGYP